MLKKYKKNAKYENFKIHFEDKNRYHDFDTPDGPGITHQPKASFQRAKRKERQNDSDVGSDFSSDGEQSGFKNKYILRKGVFKP